MRVLCVAEKPSIAKSITGILSGGQFNAVSASISRTRNNLFILPFVQRQQETDISRTMNSITLKRAPTSRSQQSPDT